MSKMSAWYMPTINLDNSVQVDKRFNSSLKIGTLVAQEDVVLRAGQWVKHNGNMYQYVQRDTKGRLQLNIAGIGENFEDRTQRFARAVWHARYKHDPVTAVKRAPSSVDMAKLRKAPPYAKAGRGL